MAYDFLELVNKINRRLNEVELTSSNFETASGFYAQAKDAVNHSIRDINQQQYNYPFNHVENEDVVSANIMRYFFPEGLKTVAMDTFRIKKDTTLDVETRKLKVELLDINNNRVFSNTKIILKCISQNWKIILLINGHNLISLNVISSM